MRFEILIYKITQMLKKPLLLLWIFAPLPLAILFGGLFEETKEQGAIPIAVVDEDKTEFSMLLVERIKKHKKIDVIELKQTSAIRSLQRGEVEAVFIIKETFAQQLLNEERDQTIELWTSPISMAVGIVQEMIASEVTRITSNIKAANWIVDYGEIKRNITSDQAEHLWKRAYQYSEEQWIPEPLMTIDYRSFDEGSIHHSEKIDSFNHYLGFWLFFTMLTTFIVTESIMKERKLIFKKIKVSYRGIASYLIQWGTANFFMLFIQQTVSLFVFTKYFDVMTQGIHIELIVFLLFCLSLSVGLAVHMKSIGMYFSVGLFLTFSINVLSGSFFPIHDFPVLLTRVAEWFPQYWVVTGGSVQSWPVIAIFITSLLIWLMSIWKLERCYD